MENDFVRIRDEIATLWQFRKAFVKITLVYEAEGDPKKEEELHILF